MKGLFVSLVIAMCCTGVVFAGEIVVNGDFETDAIGTANDDITGWTKNGYDYGNWSIAVDPDGGGGQSAMVTAIEGKNTIYVDAPDIPVGETFDASAWVYVPASSTGVTDAMFRSGAWGTRWHDWPSNVSGTDAWVQLSPESGSGAGATWVSVEADTDASGIGQVAYFDDVSIATAGAPPVSGEQMVNGDFEADAVGTANEAVTGWTKNGYDYGDFVIAADPAGSDQALEITFASNDDCKVYVDSPVVEDGGEFETTVWAYMPSASNVSSVQGLRSALWDTIWGDWPNNVTGTDAWVELTSQGGVGAGAVSWMSLNGSGPAGNVMYFDDVSIHAPGTPVKDWDLY